MNRPCLPNLKAVSPPGHALSNIRRSVALLLVSAFLAALPLPAAAIGQEPQAALPESTATNPPGHETAPTVIMFSSEADRDYILFLFLDLLEREPTEAETEKFLKMLASGKNRDDLQEEIFESDEFKARLRAMDAAFDKAVSGQDEAVAPGPEGKRKDSKTHEAGGRDEADGRGDDTEDDRGDDL